MTETRVLEALTSGIAGLTTTYRGGGMMPEQVIGLCLDRINAHDARIGAFTHVRADAARSEAAASGARWRSGVPLSPIDGVPIAVKANIALAGAPWTAGMEVYRHRLARADAPCVALLRAAGAVILGLTNMDEAALGAVTDNPWYGRTHNPHRHGYTAGGSSGGSAAAVAAGFCAAALGTDTIGSVRIPAAYCGIVGHMPRRGLISTEGVVPLSPTLDTVGVLARSAADCAILLGAMTGADFGADHRLAGQTIAVVQAGATGISAATAEAARRCGAITVPTSLDAFPFSRVQRLLLLTAEVEGAIVHRASLAETPERLSPALATMLRWGATKGSARIADARAELADIVRDAARSLAGIDAVLLPTTPGPAFAFTEAPPPTDQALFVSFGSCLGLPTTAFPVNVADGLPLSMQVVARDEALCLSIAARLSAALDLGGHRDLPEMIEHP